MTFEQCSATLKTIRRKQGRDAPWSGPITGGLALHGRLARADSDPEHQHDASSPYGVLVLESLGRAGHRDGDPPDREHPRRWPGPAGGVVTQDTTG